MVSEIRLGAECAGSRRNLLWISLQYDGSISIGFVDQTCVVRSFTSQSEQADGTVESEYVDLEGQHGLEAVTNPHFTLHDGAYFHLRGNNQPFLVEGLVWTDPGPGQEASPWIEFVSSPVRELTPFHGVPSGRPGYNIGLVVPSEDMSAKVRFDFVRAPGDPVVDGRHLSHFIELRGVILHCYAYAVPGRAASLAYRILG